MAISLSSFFTPGVVFLMALIVAVAAIVVLVFIERKLSKKVIVKKEEEETYFQREINAVKTENNPEKSLENLDRIARDFFEEKYGVPKNMSYSDLLISFREKGNEEVLKFCKGMQELFYSGDKLNEKKLNHLYNSLETFIEGEIAVKKLKDSEVKENFWKKELELDSIKKIFGGGNDKKANEKAGKMEGEKWSGPDIQISTEEEKIKNESEVKVEKEKTEVKINEIEEAEIKKPDNGKSAGEEFTEENKKKREKLQEIPKIKKPESVPYKELKIKYKKVKRKKNIANKYIESVDNLDRLRIKIKDRKKLWAFQGVAID